MLLDSKTVERLREISSGVLTIIGDDGLPFSVPVQFLGVARGGEVEVRCVMQRLPTSRREVRASLLFHTHDEFVKSIKLVLLKGQANLSQNAITFLPRSKFALTEPKFLPTLAMGLFSWIMGRRRMKRLNTPRPDIEAIYKELMGDRR